MVLALGQWNHLVAILQQDLSNAWETVDRIAAAEAAYVREQFDPLFGVAPFVVQVRVRALFRPSDESRLHQSN